jgi:N-methylhydantoinase A
VDVRRLAGVDVGGTFTDVAVWDVERGAVEIAKVLTTPDDPTRGVVEGLAPFGPDADAVVHGTTLVTNALIERRGARTGLVTTEGYRDVLEIGSELRYDTFDLFLVRPDPLVPRAWRLTVPERVGADGSEVLPLDEDAVRAAACQLAEAGVEAVAVGFFNAFRDPSHERRAVELIRATCPQLTVCASSGVAPEIREYERISTAAANAYVQPLAGRYLRKLERDLARPLLVTLSDGGIAPARVAAEQPVALVESGPAAGAMAAAHLARTEGWEDVLAFDMGGTTAKLSLVHGGAPQRAHQIEVARVHRFQRGSGLPLRIPVVELIEIGAGGGSIAATDDLGLLKVGPRSAGAAPGPACYGQGGVDPTVTDADLHLGYLGAGSFLGGRLGLDADAACRALDGLGAALGTERTRTAAGIVRVVENNMATAARVHIAEHGRDPRRYRLVAFGGAGPVHAYGVARLLHVREVVFPRAAGVASALGMLVAPRSVEHTRSLVSALDRPDWHAIEEVLAELEEGARAVLAEAGVATADVQVEVSADMRYAGQGYEVTVPVAEDVVRRRDAAGLSAAYELAYRSRFDRTLPGMPVEVVSWRLRALSPPAVDAVRLAGPRAGGQEPCTGSRRAYFPEAEGYLDTPVYARDRLCAGHTVAGPALIEEAESTVVVGPSASVRVDERENLLMTLDP